MLLSTDIRFLTAYPSRWLIASFSNNWIFAIAEDPLGKLWIGTKGGLNRYLRKEKCFERVIYTTPFEPDITPYVYDVKCSHSGQILINTPPVLSVCDPLTMRFRHFIAPLAYNGSVKDCSIPLLEDDDGNIWMGSTRGMACYQQGIQSFDFRQRERVHKRNKTILEVRVRIRTVQIKKQKEEIVGKNQELAGI